MQTTEQKPLMQQLVDLQSALELSDRAFAERIGASAGMWNNVKAGRRAMGRKLLRGVMEAFPDLRPAVLVYLEQPDA